MVGGALWAFRLVPAVAAGGVVVVAALTSRELGGTPREQTWTAVVTATATTLVVTGHLFGTTVFDVLATSALVLALLRAVRSGTARAWLLVGGLAALALLVKTLPATVLLCAVLALLAVGSSQPLPLTRGVGRGRAGGARVWRRPCCGSRRTAGRSWPWPPPSPTAARAPRSSARSWSPCSPP